MIRTAKQISVTILFSVILVLAISLCISATVISQERNNHKAETEYYRALEQEHVRKVRALLSDKGYSDSGVTMTEVVEADGSRNYTVTIHHKRMDALSQEGREEILSACRMITFADGECDVCHKFLEEDL